MNRLALLAVVVVFTACEGPEGPMGRPGIIGPMGEKGEPGPGAQAAITSVFPRSVATGLKAQVAISGVATAWNDNAQVSFAGTDIMVTRVRAASTNALVVDIEVSPTATLGIRDVSVTQGGGAPLVYRSVFQVTPLITKEIVGKPQRGSVMAVTVTHNDPAFEFDTSWTGSAFTGVTATLSPPAVIAIRDVKPHSVSLLVSIDTDAPLGQRDLRIVNNWKRPSETAFNFGGVFEVTELAELPMPLAATGTLEKAFDSMLYKHTSMSFGVEQLLSVTTTNGKGTPMLVLVPASGRFTASSLAFTNSHQFYPYASTPDTRFLVLDPSNTAGVDYVVSVVTPMRVAEAEPNEAMMSQALMVPSMVTPATISSATDVDTYKITVTQAEVGRSLRIRTRGYYSCDIRVELTLADGTPVMAPVDDAYHENVRTPPLTTAGDYFVKLSWGRYMNSVWYSYATSYELLVNWE
jgi:hypothetical protein